MKKNIKHLLFPLGMAWLVLSFFTFRDNDYLFTSKVLWDIGKYGITAVIVMIILSILFYAVDNVLKRKRH